VTDPPRGPRRPVVAALVALVTVTAAACGTGGPATTAAPPRTSEAPVRTTPSVPPTTTTTTTTTTSPPDSTPIQVGPGALATYTVQPQPSPGTCHYRSEDGDPLPDPSCTPGAIDPMVTQADIATTICRTGWTATVRPPESVTGPEKVASARAYGYTGAFATAEYDHLIPLELGGDPDDPANLWVEPNDLPGATTTHNGKDDLEYTLRELVCSGSLPLATARRAIATDWVAAARRYEG